MTDGHDANSNLAQIKRDLDGIAVGTELHENVRKHYQHLESLTANLKALGVDAGVIDGHVTDIFKKYKAAILLNIERLDEERRSPSATDGR